MKNSIKLSVICFNILMVVIVFIATILLSRQFITLDKIFSLNNIIVLIVLVILTAILSTIIVRSITTPLKKLDKNMKSVVSGKILDTRHIKDCSNLREIEELTNSYSQMLELIKKNHFDLNSQQSKTEIILEHIADGVVAFSINKQVVHINKPAIRLLELSNSEDTFEKITKKLKINVNFDEIVYLSNYKSIETKITVGENVLNIIFAPFFSNNLIPMGVIMMVRNITENVKLDNMRKEFVSNVSHELKTPLTSIKGYSETIMNGNLTPEEVEKFSKVINQEANRMGRLVSDLLQLSRFDYQKVNFKKMMFSIEDLSKSVCEKMKFVASEKHHNLECIVTVAPPKVYADKDAIEQVIVNILTNSIKYTPDGGDIKLYVGSINSNAYIKVVDNGIGIPEKDLQRIFERFYRVDKARSRKMGGTGLGLSIVKEIIDGNDGTIDIKSVVDVGTEVIITLPTKVKV